MIDKDEPYFCFDHGVGYGSDGLMCFECESDICEQHDSQVTKMYIAILDEATDYMVPTLVAHSMINAHLYFTDDWRERNDYYQYMYWLKDSYKKVTVRVNRKEYDKIKQSMLCWEGHENTICEGKGSCLVVLPVNTNRIPNVLKFAKLWKPKNEI